jgi:pimeloyl-ACP methyl ester carboxylesterase
MIVDSLERIVGFRAQWPFAARYAWVNGWRMHYVDEGVGDPILLLQGNPTWGFLYRHAILPLVNTGHRVIVPDMIGFGLSEKPAREQAHSLDGHIANLAGLVRQLDLRRLTVVCHDWGGPTGLGFAMNNQERIRALAVMSTWAWPTPPADFHTRLFPWRTMHAPLIGPYLMGRHNVLAGRGVYLSVVNREQFRLEAQAVYEAVLPDSETRLLTWVWPRWIPLDDAARAEARFVWLEAALAKSQVPALIIWDVRTKCLTQRPSQNDSSASCRMPRGRTW